MPPPSCTGIFTALEDGLDRGAVDALAGEGAVEIDDVQILEALVLEALAPAPPGIVVEHGRLVPCRRA